MGLRALCRGLRPGSHDVSELDVERLALAMHKSTAGCDPVMDCRLQDPLQFHIATARHIAREYAGIMPTEPCCPLGDWGHLGPCERFDPKPPTRRAGALFVAGLLLAIAILAAAALMKGGTRGVSAESVVAVIALLALGSVAWLWWAFPEDRR